MDSTPSVTITSNESPSSSPITPSPTQSPSSAKVSGSPHALTKLEGAFQVRPVLSIKPSKGAEGQDGYDYRFGAAKVLGTNVISAEATRTGGTTSSGAPQWAVNINLDEEGKIALATLTRRLSKYPDGDDRKHFGLVSVNALYDAPVAEEEITDGKLQIVNDLDKKSASQMLNKIKGQGR